MDHLTSSVEINETDNSGEPYLDSSMDSAHSLHSPPLNQQDKKFTFVTGYIEIPSNNTRRHPQIYLDIFIKFTASIPYPLIVYIEEKNVDRVRAALQKYFPSRLGCPYSADFDAYRIIRTREFKDLGAYKFYEDFCRARPLVELDRICSPECATVLLSKTYFLQEVIKENPFDSTYFGWIDLGVGHAINQRHTDIDLFVQTQRDRVRFSILNIKSAKLIDNREEFYSHNHYLLAGAQLSGSALALIDFHNKVELEIIEMLKVNRLGLEEQVWGALLLASPQNYDYIYGDYDHLMANMIEIRGNYQRVAKILEYCRLLSYHRLGTEIIERVRLGLDEGYEPIRELLPSMLSDGYICAYYYNQALAHELADTICLLYEHSVLMREKTANRDLLNSNLKFSGRQLGAPRLTLDKIIETPRAQRWRRLW